MKRRKPMLILGHDWYDWLMLILVGVSTISVLFGVTIQLPKIQQSLENITKSYNATASERLTITDGVTACITHAKAPHIIECSTCREYPVEELNATLRVCDIIIIDSIANTTNRTEELRILR